MKEDTYSLPEQYLTTLQNTIDIQIKQNIKKEKKKIKEEEITLNQSYIMCDFCSNYNNGWALFFEPGLKDLFLPSLDFYVINNISTILKYLLTNIRKKMFGEFFRALAVKKY